MKKIDLKISYELNDAKTEAVFTAKEYFTFGIYDGLEKSAKSLPDSCKKIILDLSDTRVIDSAGIGVLMALHHDFENTDVSFEVRGVSGNVAGILKTVKLNEVLNISFNS